MHNKECVSRPIYMTTSSDSLATDRPLFVQFCGNDPETMLRAAEYVQDDCDAVDINLGCPQGIAKKGFYGAFLLEEWALLAKIVTTMTRGLRCPVTCKIRLLYTLKDTLTLCFILVNAGCKILTIHGRTKEMIGAGGIRGPNYEWIRIIKEVLPIPVFANGGIEDSESIEYCLNYTKTDGIMSSEGVLENPLIFLPSSTTGNDSLVTSEDSSKTLLPTREELCLEYLDLAEKYPADSSYHLKAVRAHVHKFLYTPLATYHDLLIKCTKAQFIDEFRDICYQLIDRQRLDGPAPGKTWYRRHRTPTINDQHKVKRDESDFFDLDQKLEENDCSNGLDVGYFNAFFNQEEF